MKEGRFADQFLQGHAAFTPDIDSAVGLVFGLTGLLLVVRPSLRGRNSCSRQTAW